MHDVSEAFVRVSATFGSEIARRQAFELCKISREIARMCRKFCSILLMRTGGVTKIILCADHFYNKIIACFCAILRIYAPSLEGSKDAFRHELIVFQTSKLAEKAPIQRASCLGSRQDSDCTKNSHFQKMHEPLAGFCRPSFGKFPLKECASFQSIPFRIIQGKSWAPTLYCNSNAQKSWGR